MGMLHHAQQIMIHQYLHTHKLTVAFDSWTALTAESRSRQEGRHMYT